MSELIKSTVREKVIAAEFRKRTLEVEGVVAQNARVAAYNIAEFVKEAGFLSDVNIGNEESRDLAEYAINRFFRGLFRREAAIFGTIGFLLISPFMAFGLSPDSLRDTTEPLAIVLGITGFVLGMAMSSLEWPKVRNLIFYYVYSRRKKKLYRDKLLGEVEKLISLDIEKSRKEDERVN